MIFKGFVALLITLTSIFGTFVVTHDSSQPTQTPIPTESVLGIEQIPTLTELITPTLLITETPTVVASSSPTITPSIIPTIKPTSVAQPTKKPIPSTAPTKQVIQPTSVPVQNNNSTGFSCNCSKTCPQMTSCAEAQYQLNVCGCSRRDADDDGIACDAECQ